MTELFLRTHPIQDFPAKPEKGKPDPLEKKRVQLQKKQRELAKQNKELDALQGEAERETKAAKEGAHKQDLKQRQEKQSQVQLQLKRWEEEAASRPAAVRAALVSPGATTIVAGFRLSFSQAVKQQGDRHVEKRTSGEEGVASALAEV